MASTPRGFLKLNADGATRRDGSAGGVGGLVRNHKGETMLTYSKKTGPGPPILAELLAIKVGMEMVTTNQTLNSFQLIVESDSSTAIHWLSNPLVCPRVFKVLVGDIVQMGKVKSCTFRRIDRAINVDADTLAKRGIG
ncbi:hypothetical protein HRI_001322600 [Hibiscus trionum]|uniref:RNase H type-1 domain-containing protein n=1 Tax=Hibiscus trionum TaxID=183268 RepID=A0A9W7LTY4_HIBTR|nr:hypothetical protein HRI_001322600 [Hibiscus trionum]